MLEDYREEDISLDAANIPQRPLYHIAKRALDLVLGCAGLILLSPLMLLVCTLIKLDSPGPALFRQERLGKDGIPFVIYKFRSMFVDADNVEPRWTAPNDERVTRVGRVLRRMRFDEIPQLWNVIKGDMSIVGPRPERAVFYDLFEQRVSGFRLRLLVTPGITGLAQVCGGYDLDPSEKIRYDVGYIRNQSLLLDTMILMRTFAVVFSGRGAR